MRARRYRGARGPRSPAPVRGYHALWYARSLLWSRSRARFRRASERPVGSEADARAAARDAALYDARARVRRPHVPCPAPGQDQLLHEMHRRSEEHTSELQSLMRISYAVFCLKKKYNNIMHSNEPYNIVNHSPHTKSQLTKHV